MWRTALDLDEAILERREQFNRLFAKALADWTSIGSDSLAVMTVEEVIPKVVFNVDAKQREPDMVGPLVALVRRLKMQDRVRIASFHTANLRRVRALGYEGDTGLGQQEVARLVFQPAMMLRRFPVMGRAAQVPTRVGPVRLDTAAFLAKAHGLGLRVDYWTIDDPKKAEELLLLGADGIMTDDPARIIPVIRAFRARSSR